MLFLVSQLLFVKVLLSRNSSDLYNNVSRWQTLTASKAGFHFIGAFKLSWIYTWQTFQSLSLHCFPLVSFPHAMKIFSLKYLHSKSLPCDFFS